MEVLVLDGKNYIKASKAARDLGYTADYVGQLCRNGTVDAHLIGRTWYVNQIDLSTHRVEKKRISRIKAREYAKRTIAEHQASIGKDRKPMRNIAIKYESDDGELIPKTRKITVQTDHATDELNVADDDASETEILNKGDKTIMAGDLTVVDLGDEYADPDTTVFTPRTIRKSSAFPKHAQKIEQEPIQHTEEIEEPQHMVDFGDKLVDKGVVVDTKSSDVAIDNSEEIIVNSLLSTTESSRDTSRSSWLLSTLAIIVFFVFTLLSIPIVQIYTYTSDKMQGSEIQYKFSVSKAISILESKI